VNFVSRLRNDSGADSPVVAESNSSSVHLARTQFDSYGLNAQQFFGISLPFVRRAIELLPESAAAMCSSVTVSCYRPSYQLPSASAAANIQQMLLNAKLASDALNSIDGSARASDFNDHQYRAAVLRRTSNRKFNTTTEDIAALSDPFRIVPDGGSHSKATAAGRMKRASSTSLNDDSGNPVGVEAGLLNEDDAMLLQEEAAARTLSDRERYRELSDAYMKNPEAKLEARKSHIHGNILNEGHFFFYS
jgi:hypothetical protein